MLVLEGRVFYRDRLETLQIGIENGKIAAIRKVLEGEEREDHGDALILPGCVDMHVHFRDPGFPEKEDFPSGTTSAALGGVTTVVDMPNTNPPIVSRMNLEAKIAALRGRATVDYGLYAAPRSGSAVGGLRGALAFKVYMAESTGSLQVDPDAAADVLAEAAEANRPVVAHAEDGALFRKSPATSLADHAAVRPKEAEVQAIRTLAKIRGSARTHVAHVTCVEALDAVPERVTKEVTLHHLLLDFSRPLKSLGKVNPPLRSPEDRARLWEAFVQGRFDVVASDHAPHTQDEKEEGPFADAPSGLPGVATTFPILLRLVKSEQLTLERLTSMMARRPAELLGLEKGVIRVGRDADLVVVDPRDIRRVTAKRCRYKCGWTPFEGFDACFPRTVYVRGEKVVEDGEPVSEGAGRYLAPRPD